MKNSIVRHLILFVSILMFSFFSININLCSCIEVNAIEKISEATVYRNFETSMTEDTDGRTVRFNVTDLDFGANGFDLKDDREAIQKALNKAKEEIINKRNRTVIIKIPKGVYYVSDAIYIYSNTKLVVDKDAVIIAGMKKNAYMTDIIIASHLNSKNVICNNQYCVHGGYTQWENISIEGGTWDCNNMDDSNSRMVGAFLFRHGNDLEIKNLTLKNSNGHTINVSASSNVMISGVTIKDARDAKKEEFCIEAIHIDAAGTGETTAYPLDGTAAENVTIRNCTFENIYSGIGCHAIYRAVKGEKISNNIKIFNNKFKDIKYYCINAISFKNIQIKGNIANGKNEDNVFGEQKGYAFIYTRNSIGDKVIIDNSYYGGANVINNFEYPIVKYDYKIEEHTDEINNNLTSNISLQPSFVCVEFISNGGVESNIVKQVDIMTGQNERKGFRLPADEFSKPEYKIAYWKVTLDEGFGERLVGMYAPGTYIRSKSVRWHHSIYRAYAHWIKNN